MTTSGSAVKARPGPMKWWLSIDLAGEPAAVPAEKETIGLVVQSWFPSTTELMLKALYPAMSGDFGALKRDRTGGWGRDRRGNTRSSLGGDRSRCSSSRKRWPCARDASLADCRIPFPEFGSHWPQHGTQKQKKKYQIRSIGYECRPRTYTSNASRVTGVLHSTFKCAPLT